MFLVLYINALQQGEVLGHMRQNCWRDIANLRMSLPQSDPCHTFSHFYNLLYGLFSVERIFFYFSP